mgnify:CR=1 FL=1
MTCTAVRRFRASFSFHHRKEAEHDETKICAGAMPGVTKEQIQEAREADLFAYLQFHEPGVLKRDGPNYRHKEHDSLVYVTGKRYWYWNSRGRSINALDYLIQIRGYGLVDAVHALVGGEIQQAPAYRSAEAKQEKKEPEKKTFSLPWPGGAPPPPFPICKNVGSAARLSAGASGQGCSMRPGIMASRSVCLLGKTIQEKRSLPVCAVSPEA